MPKHALVYHLLLLYFDHIIIRITVLEVLILRRWRIVSGTILFALILWYVGIILRIDSIESWIRHVINILIVLLQKLNLDMLLIHLP